MKIKCMISGLKLLLGTVLAFSLTAGCATDSTVSKTTDAVRKKPAAPKKRTLMTDEIVVLLKEIRQDRENQHSRRLDSSYQGL